MKKIAVAGYGMMGLSHISALRSLGYETAVVFGRDGERTKTFAMKNGIAKWTVSFDDLVKEGVEVLHVCTPPMNHYELVKNALQSGMDVVCEKPFVFSEEEGEELVKLSEGHINAVGFNVRFHAPVKAIHAAVENREIGDILLVNGSYMQEFHALPSFFSWRYQSESAGGFLATTEIGSHWIDTMRFISGKEVEAVSATYGSFFPDRTLRDGMQFPAGSVEGESFHCDSDNVALVTFRLSDGSLANMVLSEITPGRYNYLDISVTGTKGSYWWNSEDLNRLHKGTKNAPVEENVFAFGDGFNQSVTNMLREVYADIKRGSRSSESKYASFDDGLKNTKICNAIYKSAHNNSSWEVIR